MHLLRAPAIFYMKDSMCRCAELRPQHRQGKPAESTGCLPVYPLASLLSPPDITGLRVLRAVSTAINLRELPPYKRPQTAKRSHSVNELYPRETAEIAQPARLQRGEAMLPANDPLERGRTIPSSLLQEFRLSLSPSVLLRSRLPNNHHRAAHMRPMPVPVKNASVHP